MNHNEITKQATIQLEGLEKRWKVALKAKAEAVENNSSTITEDVESAYITLFQNFEKLEKLILTLKDNKPKTNVESIIKDFSVFERLTSLLLKKIEKIFKLSCNDANRAKSEGLRRFI